MESDMGCLRWGWREEGIRESNRFGSGLALPVTVVEARHWVLGVDLPFLDFEYIWVFPTIVCRKKRQGKQKEKAWRKTSRAGEGGLPVRSALQPRDFQGQVVGAEWGSLVRSGDECDVIGRMMTTETTRVGWDLSGDQPWTGSCFLRKELFVDYWINQ